jgi:hypothetical protein
MSIPLGGTPGIFDPRNPTLLPNFDKSVASGSGTIDHDSPAAFLAANPRVNATATATIGGSVTTGDILTLELANNLFPSGLISHTYTATSSDTIGTIAEAFAKLFNDDANAQAFGVEVDAGGTSGAVLTFNHPGPVGNFSVLSAPVGEPSKITITGTATNGDTIYALFTGPQLPGGVLVSAAITTSESVTSMATALKNAINGNSTLTGLSISATSSAGVVTISVPAAAEPVVISAWSSTANETATIGGTLTVGDTLAVTITNASLPSGAVTVTYTTVSGDTTTTMATGLKNLIDNNTALIAAGIVGTSSTNVVTITWPAAIGAITFSESVGGSATESITLSAGPTEILTVGTTTTETITLSPTSGKLSGGTGPIIAANNFTFHKNGSSNPFWYGQPYLIGFDIVTDMVNQGMPIV